jgi:hypothetical protein
VKHGGGLVLTEPVQDLREVLVRGVAQERAVATGRAELLGYQHPLVRVGPAHVHGLAARNRLGSSGFGVLPNLEGRGPSDE